MIIGLGSDLCNIVRIQNSLDRFGDRFIQRVFTPVEQAKAARRPLTRAGTLAKRFAAKEAALKALGLGLGGMPMYDIEVVRDGLGPPRLVLHGAAAEVAREAGVRRWLVTMSHTSTLAQATVVAL